MIFITQARRHPVYTFSSWSLLRFSSLSMVSEGKIIFCNELHKHVKQHPDPVGSKLCEPVRAQIVQENLLALIFVYSSDMTGFIW